MCCSSLYFSAKGDGTSATNPSYILKTYHGQRNEQYYRHEVQAFARLLQNPVSEHVVKCYATFKHGETYNLVMEWVPGGDLLQYFQHYQPPRTFEEVTDFWDSLLKLNIGLDRIHQIILRDDLSHQYQLVHQDIKPDNILLDIRSPSRPYRFSPIVADLGHSHIKADNHDIPAVDHRGNQMYCAPESSHHSGFSRAGPNGITWQTDIFSAGAVLSEAASWVAKGEVGRKEYFNRRKEQLENTEGLAFRGYETAFHNGFERLSSVDEMHRDIRTTLPSHDRMTPRVLDIIENHMLVLPKNRLQAKLLYSMFEKEVWDAKAEAKGEEGGLDKAPPARSLDMQKTRDALPEPETPPLSGKADRIWAPPGSAALSISTDGYSYSPDALSAVRSPSRPIQSALLNASKVLSGVASPPPMLSMGQPRRPFTTPNQPSSTRRVSQVFGDALGNVSEPVSILSMQDASDWRKAMKLEGLINAKKKKVVDELISNLKGRDFLFLIDDTESMEKYSMQIEVAFQTLAYIAKNIDPNDLGLSFVSKPLDIINSRKTSLLLQQVSKHMHKHLALKGRIESSLSTLINERIIKRLPVSIPLFGHVPKPKPITIFVFTDGQWGDEVRIGNGLDTPIGKLMQEMKTRGMNRTHVMFQFLRFGDSEEGREHLAYLDNFESKEQWSVSIFSSPYHCLPCILIQPTRSIVDTRDIDGDVYQMFLANLINGEDRLLNERDRFFHERSGEAGESRLAVPEDGSSKEEALLKGSQTHEADNKLVSAEAPEAEHMPNSRSNATSESFRDSSPSTHQLNNPASLLQSSLETHSRRSTAPSTRVSGYLLDQVEKSSAATSLNELHQPGLFNKEIRDDIESIASIPDSIDSTASASHPLGQIGVNYIVAKFTQYDSELNKIYTEASQKLTQARFVDNNRRLLKLFYLDISREAHTAPQVEAASFLKSRSRRHAISLDIFQTMIPDDRPPLPLMYREKEFLELDRYFNTLETVDGPVDREKTRETDHHATHRHTDNETDDSSDEDSENSSNRHGASQSASSLQATGNFLVKSQAFLSYKQRLHEFISPNHENKDENAGLPVHFDPKHESKLAPHHEKGHGDGEFKLELSENEVSKDDSLGKDGFESQKKAVSVESPSVAGRQSDPDINPTSESIDEVFSPTTQDLGLDLSVVAIPLSTRVTKWITDRLWPPRKGSQRIWYLCVSIHFSLFSNSSDV